MNILMYMPIAHITDTIDAAEWMDGWMDREREQISTINWLQTIRHNRLVYYNKIDLYILYNFIIWNIV